MHWEEWFISIDELKYVKSICIIVTNHIMWSFWVNPNLLCSVCLESNAGACVLLHEEVYKLEVNVEMHWKKVPIRTLSYQWPPLSFVLLTVLFNLNEKFLSLIVLDLQQFVKTLLISQTYQLRRCYNLFWYGCIWL
jgi:hypothetical protein